MQVASRIFARVTGRGHPGLLVQVLIVLVFAGALAMDPRPVQAAPSHNATEHIRLQLKWRHAFQFAGYYAAVEQGYYRDAGLDVEILEAKPGQHPASEVVTGRAEYGVSDSSIILQRAAGKPVVVLNVIFQHSALVLLALNKGAEQSVHSLRGKRLMLVEGDSELRAYLQKEGLAPGTYEDVPNSFKIDDLLEGKTDAFSAYITDQPHTLERLDIPYVAYSPRAAGIDFYGDNLFTSEAEIRKHPRRVERFREASLKGWAYAMANPREIIDLILRDYSQERDAESLAYEADQMLDLIQPEFVAMGYMHQGRWRHIADIYAEIGLLRQGVSLDGMLYKDRLEVKHHIDYRLILLSLAGLLIVGFAALRFYRLSESLRQDILAREKAEREKADLEARMFQGQKMEAIGNLAGGVAHDINNVLAVVLGLGSVLQSQMADDDPGRGDMHDILEAAARGQGMVKNLLGFARKGDYAKSSWCPNEAIGAMAELLGKLIPKSVVLKTELSSTLEIYGDRHQFETVLMNLCVNASQAIKHKGTIEILTSDHVVDAATETASAPRRYVRMEVKDDGCGMAPESLEHAFEPFFTTKEVGVGTGLGLSMVLGVVENHGGTVSLDSTAGVGTTVSILLPAATASADVLRIAPVMPVASVEAQRGGRILVVDDERLVRRSVQRMLERSGYEVLLAECGQSAIDIFRKEHRDIDLVLLDLSMPRMSGRQCFDSIRVIDPDVLVLISTGHGNPADTADMLTQGALGVLAKPYSMNELATVLASHLHHGVPG